MSKVSLSSKSGKVFWASLLGYCAVFTVFYFNTQFSLGKLEAEMRNGSIFDTLRHTACEQTLGCKQITYLPYLVLNQSTGKYKVQVVVDINNSKSVNSVALNKLLDEQRANFPWYVNNKLDSIEITFVNGNKVTSEQNKPDWYLSLISMFG